MRKRNVIAVPYAIVRVPLSYLDVKLVRRLPEDAAVRMAFDQAIGGIDLCAGHALGIESISRNGVERVQNAGGRVRTRTLGAGGKTVVDPAREKDYALTRPLRRWPRLGRRPSADIAVGPAAALFRDRCKRARPAICCCH